MTMNRLITLLMRMFARRWLWRMAGSARRRPAPGPRTGPANAHRAQRDAVRRARQAARVTRRLGR